MGVVLRYDCKTVWGYVMRQNEMKPILDDYTGSKRVRICTLMVTHACNLNCTYCYESYKSDKAMTFELAQEILRKEVLMVKKSDTFDAIQVDFMGGEPLMNFPLIRDVVEWLEREPPVVPYICFATTNGTLLTEERKSWFRIHRDTVCLGVSFDGTDAMQRINRGTGECAIDFEFFHETWPFQSVHMTISKETLPHLGEGILSVQRHKHFRVEAALANGVDWDKDDAILYRAQLSQLGEAYLDDATILPVNLLGRTLQIESSNDAAPVAPQQKYCGTGTHTITYDVDGLAYGCHLFGPVVLGASAVGIDKFDWENADTCSDPRCDYCVLRNICPTCAGFNYRYRGALGKRDMRGCLMALANALSACEFQIKLIAKRRAALSLKEASVAQSAMDAYPILSQFGFPDVVAPFRTTTKGGGKEVKQNEHQSKRVGKTE